jgi:hypothetical protein
MAGARRRSKPWRLDPEEASNPGTQRPRVDLRGPVRPTELVLVELLLAPPATFFMSFADNFFGFFASAMVMSFHEVQRNHGPLGRVTPEYSIQWGQAQAADRRWGLIPRRFPVLGLVRRDRQPTIMQA